MTRVIAISDSDSYLKWSVATLRALPSSWSSTQLVVKNPVLPSPEQARAAAGRSVPVLSYSALMGVLRRATPDVVLLAASGPVVAALTAAPPLRAANRPVLVTGLPGISVPATPRAITLRTGCDLFVLHSHREVAEFAELADELSMPATFGLASLPYLSRRPEDADVPPPGTVSASRGDTPRTPRDGAALRGPGQGAAGPRRSGADPAGPGRDGFGGGQAARAQHRVADPPRTVAVSAAVRRPGPAGADRSGCDSVRGRADGPGAGPRPWPGHGVLDSRAGGHGRWPAGACPARLRRLPGDDQHSLRGLGLPGYPHRPGRRPSVSRGSGLDGRKLLPSRSREHLADPAGPAGGRPCGRQAGGPVSR